MSEMVRSRTAVREAASGRDVGAGRHAFDEDAALTPIFHALNRSGWRGRQHEQRMPEQADAVVEFQRDPLTAPIPIQALAAVVPEPAAPHAERFGSGRVGSGRFRTRGNGSDRDEARRHEPDRRVDTGRSATDGADTGWYEAGRYEAGAYEAGRSAPGRSTARRAAGRRLTSAGAHSVVEPRLADGRHHFQLEPAGRW